MRSISCGVDIKTRLRRSDDLFDSFDVESDGDELLCAGCDEW